MTTRAIYVSFGFSVLFTIAFGACRPDPGNSDYESQEQFNFGSGDGEPSNFAPGPDPYIPGEDRLSIGAFYEGESSELVPVDDITTHLYIYEETLLLIPDSERLEGLRSIGIYAGLTWWGCGVHWDFERSLQPWSTLHIAFRSDSAVFDEIEIGMNDPAGTFSVQATDYGWAANDEWNTLEIPLSDFADAGLDLERVIAPLVLLGGAGGDTGVLLVDNVYLTAD